MPWVTLDDTSQCQPASFGTAMLNYGNSRIFRTGWIETALITHPRRYQILVAPYQPTKQVPHSPARPSNAFNSVRSTGLACVSGSDQYLTTTSIRPSSCRRNRNASRMIRRSRDRSTAWATCLRPMIIPSRALPSKEPPGRVNNKKCLLRNRP